MATGHYLPFAVFGALAPVLPDRIMAASGSPLWSMIQTGVRANGRTYANVFFFNGGMGATDGNDGQSTYAWPSNVSNVPVELIERNSPLIVHRKELCPGSGGAGRFRGGLGQEIEFEVASDTPIGMIFMAERCRFPAPGMNGGETGGRGEVRIDGAEVDYRRNVVLEQGAARAAQDARRRRHGTAGRARSRDGRAGPARGVHDSPPLTGRGRGGVADTTGDAPTPPSPRHVEDCSRSGDRQVERAAPTRYAGRRRLGQQSGAGRCRSSSMTAPAPSRRPSPPWLRAMPARSPAAPTSSRSCARAAARPAASSTSSASPK